MSASALGARGRGRVDPAASLSAIEGVSAMLTKGVRVAQIACRDGEALVRLAEAFPRSTWHGFDHRAAAIRAARVRAAAAGVSDRVTFEVTGPGACEGRATS